jgi:hypothetical protein
MEASALNSTLVLLAAVMFYTLLIERLMEVFKALYDYLEFVLGGRDYWNRSALRLVHTLERQRHGNRLQVEVSKAVNDYLSRDHPGFEGVEALSAERLRTLVLRGVMKLAAIVVGLIVAVGMDINIFDLLRDLNQAVVGLEQGDVDKVNVYFSSDRVPSALGIALTGIAMGLGSDPLHRVITRLEKQRRQRKDA